VKESLTKETRESFFFLAFSVLTLAAYVGLGLLAAYVLG
jgi:hypothetical protein